MLFNTSQERSEDNVLTDPLLPPRPPTSIPSILFSQGLRLFILRCILVAGSFTLAYEVYWWKFLPGIIILSVTILHHLLR
jgi:hypothetical protein